MEFLLQDKILFPFLATLGASLAVIGIQALTRYEREQKKRIYAVNYMLDVAFRILSSALIVKQHTIIPHIEATKRIMDGDDNLLKTTLLSDEFDILKTKGMHFSHLPNDYKLYVGYDDIELVQMFDTLVYLYESDENRSHLNIFVKDNLKSMAGFLSLDNEQRNDVLNTYWDILSSLEHEENRLLVFVRDVVSLRLKSYIKGYQFLLFRTSNAEKKIGDIENLIEENKKLFPKPNYMEKVRHGGIQREL